MASLPVPESGTRHAPGDDDSGDTLGLFDLLLVFALSSVSVAVVAGVASALLGVFNTLPVGAIGVAGGVALTAPAWRVSEQRNRVRVRVPDLVVVLIAAVWLVWNAGYAGQQVFPRIDPGVYNGMGWWLADESSPLISLAPGLIDATDGSYSFSGYLDDRGDGQLSPQFLLGLPVLLAIARAVGGTGVFYVAPVAMGAVALLALYAFATRFVPRRWAVLAPASLAVSLVHMHFSRSAYTEPLTLFLLFGGAWMLLLAVRGLPLAVPAGLALGSALAVRIDALMVLVALPLLIAHLGAQGDRSMREVLRAAVTAVGVGAVAFADLVLLSPSYWAAQQRRLSLVVAVVLAATLGAVAVVVMRRQVMRVLRRYRRLIATAATGVVVAGIAVIWVIRPLGPPARGGVAPFIGELLGGEGLDPDPTRSMAEMTGIWLWWYLGPVLIAALLGLVAMVRRAVLHPEPGRTLLLGMVLVTGVVYLWQPTVNPIHLWAMRRFLPVVIPAAIVLAVWWAATTVARIGGSRLRTAATLGVCVVMLTPIVRIPPVASASPEAGSHQLVLNVCAVLPDDALLVAAGTEEDRLWGAALRILCRVPVVVTGGGGLGAVMREAAGRGRDVLWFGSGCRPPGEVLASVASVFPVLEFTVSRPPSGFVDSFYGVVVVRPSSLDPFVCEGHG